jgi:glycosyltransferase involved in cell wall biosynthesis
VPHLVRRPALSGKQGILKISIIIPAYNEEKLIAGTLESVQNAATVFGGKGWLSEIIVCDNNSTDRTAEIARGAGAVVVFEAVNQIGRARNRGAEAATGDWLIFVDADSQPGRGLFGEVAATIETGRYLFGGCVIKFDEFHFLWSTAGAVWNCTSRIMKYVAGSFIFCETAAFRKAGGFDAKMFVGEELDLSKRLLRLAKETGKQAIILHRHPLVTSARKVRLYSARELLWFLAKSAFTWRRTVTDKKACHAWYDGRR